MCDLDECWVYCNFNCLLFSLFVFSVCVEHFDRKIKKLKMPSKNAVYVIYPCKTDLTRSSQEFKIFT